MLHHVKFVKVLRPMMESFLVLMKSIMFLFWKEKAALNNELIFSKEFKKYVELLSNLFKLSRMPENVNSPEAIYELQRGVWMFIKKMESSLKDAKLEARSKWGGPLNNDLNVFAHKRLIRIARTIMDGVVWRNIGYKRVWAHLLAYNKRNPLNDDYEKLLFAAESFSKDYISIIGDLTETIRIWDLLFIDDDWFPLLTEAKDWKNGKLDLYNLLTIDPNNKPSRQLTKVLDTQKILISWELGRLNMKIHDVDDILPTRYFSEIIKGIEDASVNWFWIWRLNKCVSVRIIDIASFLWKKDKEFFRMIAQRPQKIIRSNKDDRIVPISSFDSFYFDETIFLRGFPPYSIFPFSDEVCMRIMSGEIQIVSYINLSNLVSFFNANEWRAELILTKSEEPPSMQARNFSELFWEHHTDDTLLKIRKEDWYCQTLTVMEVLRLWYEFLSPKTFIEKAELLYLIAKKERDEIWSPKYSSHAINFQRDNEIFN